MNIKSWQIGVTVIVLIVVYLLAAHYYIYHMIGVAGLSSTDNRHEYMFNSELSGPGLVYVSLGDSLTAGVGTDKYEQSYPYLLAEKLAGKDKKIRHLNYSYPGARTEDLIRDLLSKAVTEQPDLVTLLIGTNDVHGNVDQEEFAKNYQYILRELRQKTTAKINLVNIPYIGSDSLLLPPYKYYYNTRIGRFNDVIKALATEQGANYIDLLTHTADLSRGAAGYYAADNFHPSNLGYKIWSDFIYEHLNQ